MGEAVLLVRVDANDELGAGHLSRCGAIAREAQALGRAVLFAVSDDESAERVRQQGFEVQVLGGDWRHLGADDARILAELARACGAGVVLVDSYAASGEFFESLALKKPALGAATARIDDCYSFATGFLPAVAPWPVDVLVSYGFAHTDAEYEAAYAGAPCPRLAIGPQYAPIREVFRSRAYEVRPAVRRVLLTSGSTNPQRALERMVSAFEAVGAETELAVVVGPHAEFDETCLDGRAAEIIRGSTDLSEVMAECDMAVAAAGVTLYELACLGVPTIAVPVVANQLDNVAGWRRLLLGPALDDVDWGSSELARAVEPLLAPADQRAALSQRARTLVDGCGARRIAEVLFEVTEV